MAFKGASRNCQAKDRSAGIFRARQSRLTLLMRRLTLVEAAASDSVDGTKRGGRSSLHPESAPSDQTKQSRD
jgi:hypothetical protein